MRFRAPDHDTSLGLRDTSRDDVERNFWVVGSSAASVPLFGDSKRVTVVTVVVFDDKRASSSEEPDSDDGFLPSSGCGRRPGARFLRGQPYTSFREGRRLVPFFART